MNPVVSYRIHGKLADAEASIRAALQAQGFGILTEVDVTATFRVKLGIEARPYKLLGACNPALAHAALEAEPASGAFLPCGIALREMESGTETMVYLQNPLAMATMFGNAGLEAPANEASSRLNAALSAVGEPA